MYLVSLYCLQQFFKMHTILFLARNSVTVLATAAVVVFQPELRRALEKLGEKQFLSSIVPFETNKESSRFSEDTMDSIIDAAYNMGTREDRSTDCGGTGNTSDGV